MTDAALPSARPSSDKALRARGYVLAAALLWSTAGAAIKLAGGREGLTATQIAGGRALFAALALGLLVPEARRGFTRTVLLVGVAYAATTVLFVWANTLTTAANAIFLQDLAPVWVLLLAPFALGERPTRSELLSAPIYLVGCGLFFADELKPGHAFGNGVAIASGVAFASLILGLRKLKGGGGDAAAFVGNLIALAACAPLAASGIERVGPREVGIVAYLGVFQLGLAYWFFARGVRVLSATEASLLGLLEPVLSSVWAFLLAGERPGPFALAGAGIILSATVWKTALLPSGGARALPPRPAEPAAEPIPGRGAGGGGPT